MKYRRALLHYPRLYDVAGSDELFLRAMREITAYHMVHNATYAGIAKKLGFKLKSLRRMQDLHRIPALPTLYLKRNTLYSVPQRKVIMQATTSGTSGRKSEVGIDVNTGLYEVAMAFRTLWLYGLVSPVPTNYIIMGYQFHRGNQLGLARSAFAFSLVTPTLHREYALKYNGEGYDLNLEGLARALFLYEKQGLPVRFMGLPDYYDMLLSTLKKKGIKLKLHPESRLCLGGGWKQFYFENADKSRIYRMAEEVLGIPEHNCIDFFGTVEHPVLYCDCKNHQFHVPVFSRVIIRDVDTLQPVPMGTPGLLNLVSPLMRSMPMHSIITDDLAILHGGKECGCGNTAPYFELLGRAGLQDIKTCAAGAAQYLSK